MKHASILAVAAVALAPAVAHADGFLIVTAGGLVPIGDEDWEDVAEPSANFSLRGGAARKLVRHSRVAFEAALEYSPMSTDFNNPLIDVELTRFRVLLGGRFEQLLSSGVLLSLHGGIGLSHLRAEVSALNGAFSDSDSDSGLALDLGGGVWFAATRSILVGADLSLPMAFHDDDTNDGNDANLDFSMTEIAFSAGVRFAL